MNLSEIKETAEVWALTSPFDLIDFDEVERRIVFESKSKPNSDSVSFYIIFPESLSPKCSGAANADLKKDTHWHVWSENDSVLVQLDEVIGWVQGCSHKSLTDVLNRCNKALSPMLGKNANNDSDEGDNDDDDDDEDDGIDVDFEFDDYYGNDDQDALTDVKVNLHESDEESPLYCNSATPGAAATHRILKDLKSLKKSEGSFGVTGEPRGDNLFLWDVNLKDIPENTSLGRDIQSYARKYKREPVIHLEMKFPSEYPMAPPFVRILRPRFQFRTGHVTVGGSICMEMLTRSGWRPTNDIESMLVQIRAEILSDTNARLDSNPDKPYDEAQARIAFDRMVQTYGWNK